MEKKVCIISHSSGLGGAELSLLDLVETFRELGLECKVILPYPKGPLANRLEKLGVEYTIIPYGWWAATSENITIKIIKNIIKSFLGFPLIFLKIYRWKSDLILSNSSVVFIGSFSSKILNLKHIWFIREFGAEDHKLSFFLGERLSYYIINKLSDLVIVNSLAIKQKFKKFIPDHKFFILYPYKNSKSIFLKENSFSNRDHSSLKCITIGSISPGKGHDDAIRAIANLHNRNIPVELIIVGKINNYSPYFKYLKEIINEYNLENYISFIDWVDDISPHLMKSDIFLMCSHYEAFGRVTVEAMLHKKPIIGSRSGGTIELVKDGFNGLLYNPRDHYDLAEKILYLYKNRKLIEEYGQNGFLWALENFSPEKYRSKLQKILSNI